ncbi:MAG: hypothetical protein ABI467_08440 [Kofleriaceae bacterium]
MLRLGTILGVLASAAGDAHADRKDFTNTYEYATTPEGHVEVELWHTELRDSWDVHTPQRFEQRIEVELGLTDHWDIAMYTFFREVAAEDPTVAAPLSFHAVHVESRYRIAERGELPVDTMLYLELAKEFGESAYEIESKLILARDFGPVTVALNLIDEATVGNDVPGGENELGFALGATYELTPKLHLGAETWANHGDDGTRWSAGPALAFAPSSRWWVAMTGGFGVVTLPGADLGKGLGAFSARIIMGFEL